MNKILIADDEPHIRLLLEQTLEDLEFEDVKLLFAKNGLETLEIIQKERPKVVILDIMMPGKTGIEICQTVKATKSLEDTYIILLTARGQENDKKRGIEAGADLYLTKPFSPDEIINRVKNVLY